MTGTALGGSPGSVLTDGNQGTGTGNWFPIGNQFDRGAIEVARETTASTPESTLAVCTSLGLFVDLETWPS